MLLIDTKKFIAQAIYQTQISYKNLVYTWQIVYTYIYIYNIYDGCIKPNLNGKFNCTVIIYIVMHYAESAFNRFRISL